MQRVDGPKRWYNSTSSVALGDVDGALADLGDIDVAALPEELVPIFEAISAEVG